MTIRSTLDKLDGAASYLQSPLLLVIRLYWGWSFIQTGLGKLKHLDKVTGFFESLHIPMPRANAIAAGSTETICGALIGLGLFARPASIPLIVILSLAYVTADNEALHAIFSDTDKFTSATPFLFLFAAVIVLAFGPGKLSLDALFFRKSASGK
ncbi:MAG: DoxX family protein [Lacunisphaera sp.]